MRRAMRKREGAWSGNASERRSRAASGSTRRRRTATHEQRGGRRGAHRRAPTRRRREEVGRHGHDGAGTPATTATAARSGPTTAAARSSDGGDGVAGPGSPRAAEPVGAAPARPTGRSSARVSCPPLSPPVSISATVRGQWMGQTAHFAPIPVACHTGLRRVPPWPERRRSYRCQECGAQEPKWAGRCSACEAWGSLVEEVVGPRGAGGGARPAAAVPAPDRRGRHRGVGARGHPRRRARPGAPGRARARARSPCSAASPGIGKSTLLLQALAGLAKAGQRCLYVTAEESAQQVRLRAERLGALPPHLWLVSDTALPARARPHRRGRARRRGDRLDPDGVRPRPDARRPARSRRCASAPTASCARRRSARMSLGARRPRHQGRRAGRARGCSSTSSTRCCRSRASATTRCACCGPSKHRFGVHRRARAVRDDRRRPRERARPVRAVPRRPATRHARLGRRARARRAPPAARRGAGARRAVQRSPRPAARPRASTAGGSRSSSPCCSSTCSMPFAEHDVHTVVAGGVTAVEPGADLALALALASAHHGLAVPADLVACGEVGLGGELRQVHQTARRLAEAARLGFRRAVVPASAPLELPGIEVLRVRHARRGRAPGRAPTTSRDAPRVLSRRRPAADQRAPGSIGRWRPAAVGRAPVARSASSPPARRCATGSTGSSRRRWAASSSSATAPRCSTSARAGSCSTPPSARSACRSWPRWTAPSSWPPTPAASPGPTCTSCRTRTCPPRRPAPATAPPSGWPARSTCR